QTGTTTGTCHAVPDAERSYVARSRIRLGSRLTLRVWSSHRQGVPGHTALQMIPTGIMTPLILHLDGDNALGIARVPLLNPLRFPLHACDGNRLEVICRV